MIEYKDCEGYYVYDFTSLYSVPTYPPSVSGQRPYDPHVQAVTLHQLAAHRTRLQLRGIYLYSSLILHIIY